MNQANVRVASMLLVCLTISRIFNVLVVFVWFMCEFKINKIENSDTIKERSVIIFLKSKHNMRLYVMYHASSKTAKELQVCTIVENWEDFKCTMSCL